MYLRRRMLSGELTDLVKVSNVNWNWNIGGVAVVEEMIETDFDGNGADDLAEARHLQILYVPDFEHEGTKPFADEGHLAIVKIYRVKVRVGESAAESII